MCAIAQDSQAYPTTQSFKESGYNYLWTAVIDETDSFADPEKNDRYRELIDLSIRVGASYGNPFNETDLGLREAYQQLLALDDTPPLYVQYRFHSSQIDDDSPDSAYLRHGNALLEVAFQMDETGYSPYLAGATWLKAAELLGHVALNEDKSAIELSREHGIELLVEAASLNGIDPKFHEFISVRIANFGFQYITLPREDQEVLCKALLDDEDAQPWIARYSSGGLRIKLAWDERGYGYSREVSDVQWKGFQRNLRKAHLHLTAAWEIHPDWPWAATELITATMGHQMRPDRGTDFWFDQATNARVDHYDAYKSFAYDLYPKWHGSIEHLYSLVDYVVELSEHNPSMGRILLKVLSSTAEQLDDPMTVLTDARYLPRVTQLMLDEVELDLPYNNNLWRRRALRAVAFGNFQTKNYAQSAELLQIGGAMVGSGWSTWRETQRFRSMVPLLATPASEQVIAGLIAHDSGDTNAEREALLQARKILKSNTDSLDPDLSEDPVELINYMIRQLD